MEEPKSTAKRGAKTAAAAQEDRITLLPLSELHDFPNDRFDLFSRQLVRRNLVDLLFFERGEKALHPCVVEAMSGAAETLYHTAARQLGTKG